ncbi:hypothetical protein SFRURICE_015573 [Spodoptera frugiperda]|nr:hypothetical protein SFRURICE_015573 [Spodoptera frugiperda]
MLMARAAVVAVRVCHTVQKFLELNYRRSADLRTARKGSSSPDQIQTRACAASRSACASKSHLTTTDGAQ